MLRLRASALLVAGTVLAAGCSSAPVEDQPVVEVFGSWRGVDAERFAATIAPFEKETGIDVRIVGSASFVRDINDRVTNADLPDVGIFPQPSLDHLDVHLFDAGVTGHAGRGDILAVDARPPIGVFENIV